MMRAIGTAVAALLSPVAAQQPVADPARAFFAAAPIVAVQIHLEAAAEQGLREAPRTYVPADLRLDDQAFARVGIKLKGAAGSFREFDDRPGFTLHLGKFGGSARWHGLRRFHLNNGVQDDTRLCEWLGHELFTAAGLPAPRVAHARVRLGTRDLGLYVFREAFDGAFLQRAFGHAHGNLYDGGFCQDIDRELEKDAGDGADDRSDLRALAALCAGIDQRRERALAAAIDVSQFLDFAALEAMLGHWDGYTQNANNFRLWLPTGGKAVFLPHGMDQLFGDPEAPVLDHPRALVASAVLQQPAFRTRYRARLQALLPLFAPERLLPKVAAIGSRIEADLRRHAAAAAFAYQQALRDLEQRLRARYEQLRRQVASPEPKPLLLAAGRPHPLKTWLPAAHTDGLDLSRQALDSGVTWCIAARPGDGVRHGRFRSRVLLGPGRYELRGVARCRGVLMAGGEDGEHGAWLAADGATSERLRGDRNWQPLVVAFAVSEFQRHVELACELRADAGTVWFRSGSLALVRIGD